MFPSSKWRPLICEDTGVAYSLAPDFQRTIIFNAWPIDDGELSRDKVKTTIAYGNHSGKLLISGLGLAPFLKTKEITIQKWFWDFMEWKDKQPSSEMRRTCCKEFLSCLYDYLAIHLDKILPLWDQRAIEFVFSTPKHNTYAGSKQDMERLIKAAGFSALSKH